MTTRRLVRWLGRAAWVVAVFGLLGLLAWQLLIASAPLYSFDEDQTFGHTRIYYPLLIVVAFVGGYLVPSHSPLVGVALGLPGFLASPWNAPRGDNDGLWVFIVPLLGGFVVLLGGIAFAGGSLREARERRTG